jgi:hypothetical protein
MSSLDTSPAERNLQPIPVLTERRRKVRHKVHTPAYACLNPDVDQSLDLCEIVDISEAGMAIQAFSPLKVSRDENFSLDLAETSTFIQTGGQIAWSEPSGRAGIRFSPQIAASLPALRQWLFANAIAGCDTSESALQNDLVAPERVSPAVESFGSDAIGDQAPVADYTAVLAGLDAVQREVESLGTDLDAVLQLVVRRALHFTRASGAAIAMSEGEDLICCASTGSQAPPLGARLHAGEGFSGECVRVGVLLRCDDSETDPRVDRESSRLLGIRSMMAGPIRARESIKGLLEVFSSEPCNFGPSDEIVLQRLTSLVSAASDRAAAPADSAKVTFPVDDEFPVEMPADLPLPQLSGSRNLVMLAAVLTVVFVVVWLISTWNNGHIGSASSPSEAQVSQPKYVPPSPNVSVSSSNLEALRKLADQGDSAAQFDLGVRYATGQDVPSNYAEAARWFTSAAERGNVAAQATLGTYYWLGRGVAKDPIKAYFWSLVAEANGDATGKDRSSVVASHLTRGQALAVQQQAEQWVGRHPPTSPSSTPMQ